MSGGGLAGGGDGKIGGLLHAVLDRSTACMVLPSVGKRDNSATLQNQRQGLLASCWNHEPSHQNPPQLGDQREPGCLDQLSRAPAALSILVRGAQAGERSEDVVGGESNPHLHQD